MLKKVLVGVLACNLLIGCNQQTDVSTIDDTIIDENKQIKMETVILEIGRELHIPIDEIEEIVINTKTNYPHYNKNNISEISNVSYDRLYSMLKSTKLAELTDSFIKAEEQFNVNALTLVSIIALESGWGTSKLSINNNNLSGYAIYNRGSSYSFSSKEECIIATARLLSEDYLNVNGKYHNGKSLQAINKKYCASGDWYIKVDSIARELLRKGV